MLKDLAADAFKRRQAEKAISFLNSLIGFKVEGLLTAQGATFDVEGIWHEVIKYETTASSSCLLTALESQLDVWLHERASFLAVSSAVFVSVVNYGLVPLVKVEIDPDTTWIKTLCGGLQRDRHEFDVVLVNQEQTRLLAFVETEHEILAFERMLIHNAA